jgi:hypothetical protein
MLCRQVWVKTSPSSGDLFRSTAALALGSLQCLPNRCHVLERGDWNIKKPLPVFSLKPIEKFSHPSYYMDTAPVDKVLLRCFRTQHTGGFIVV